MNMKKKRFIKNAIALIMSIIVTMMITIVISLIAAIPVYFYGTGLFLIYSD